MATESTQSAGLSRRAALRTSMGTGIGLAVGTALLAADPVRARQTTPAAGDVAGTRAVLTLDGALVLIEAARPVAAALGVPMVIVVVDESGILKAFARMEGTGVGSMDLAIAKAYTAAAFRTPTHELGERFQDNPLGIASFTSAPRVVLLGGGLPVAVGDTVVGAIGCSGGTPDQDIEVAQAALDALALA